MRAQRETIRKDVYKLLYILVGFTTLKVLFKKKKRYQTH